MRTKRNAGEVNRALEELKAKARSAENILPSILACVEAYATIGEISNTLREIWGEY